MSAGELGPLDSLEALERRLVIHFAPAVRSAARAAGHGALAADVIADEVVCCMRRIYAPMFSRETDPAKIIALQGDAIIREIGRLVSTVHALRGKLN